jgi:hypothetical protein
MNAQSFFNNQATHVMASLYFPGPSQAQEPAKHERRFFNHCEMRCIQELHGCLKTKPCEREQACRLLDFSSLETTTGGKSGLCDLAPDSH